MAKAKKPIKSGDYNAKIDTAKTRSEQIKEEHKLIIDSYLSNGMNGAKAVRDNRPDISNNSAKVIFRAILKTPEAQTYLQEKRQEMRASIGLGVEQVARELMNWAYADPTDYIGLSAQELKELPPEQRRTLDVISKRETIIKPDGTPYDRETLIVKQKDQSVAIEKLIKMMGYYEADNLQKGGQGANITNVLHNLPLNEQKTVLQALQLIKKANEIK